MSSLILPLGRARDPLPWSPGTWLYLQEHVKGQSSPRQEILRPLVQDRKEEAFS